MPKSEFFDKLWSPYSLLAILGVGALAFLAISYDSSHREERYRAAVSAQQTRIAECISRDDTPVFECLRRAEYPPYQNTEGAFHLRSQQDMAKWALLMFVVTGVGVVYVALTLHEARQATAAARDTVTATCRIGSAQLRAYLTVQSAEVVRSAPKEGTRHNPRDDTEFEITCRINILNSGQTPAFHSQGTAMLSWMTEHDARAWNPTERPTSVSVVGPNNTKAIINTLKGRFSNPSIRQMEADGKSIWARGVMEYQDIDQLWWQLSYCFRLKSPNDLEHRYPQVYTDPLCIPLHDYFDFNDLQKIEKPFLCSLPRRSLK